MSMIISEAFRKLEFLSEDTFELNDDGIDELKSFIDSDEVDDTVDIIDPEAESEEEIKDSYLGKVILDCAVCHSKIYKDAEEVTIEEGEELANTSEECPYCYTTDGYKVIGQVSNFTPNEVKVEVDGDDEVDVEIEDEETDKVEESFKSRRKDADEGLVPTPSVSMSIGEDTDEGLVPTPSVSLSIGEAGNMDNYVDRRPNAGSIGNDLFNVYETGLNGRKCIAQGVNIDKATKLRKQGSRDGFISVYNVNKDPYAKKDADESLSESFDEIALTADGQKITVKSEPAEQPEEFVGEETIAPVSQEVEDEIVANNEGEAEVDVDEFSEENFDELGEGYLKEVYDNVKSYKTTSVTSKGNSIKLEGVITFTSGKQKQTQFVFEAKDITKKGKARFIGENKQICRGNKAFTLTGSIKSGKFLAESFNYNYRANGSKRVYGTIKRK